MNFIFQRIGNNVIISFKGVVSFHDLDRANNMIYGDARFDLMDYAVFDFRNIDRLNLSRDEVLIISALDKSASYWNKKLKLACVADDYDTKERVISYIKLMKKVIGKSIFLTIWNRQWPGVRLHD